MPATKKAETRAEHIDPAALAAAGYQQKLAALEGLKKSLLHQAFSGAL